MIKKQVVPLASGNCRIRLLEEKDLENLRRWRNQDHIRVWFVHTDKITSEQQHSWWESYQKRDDDYLFIIEETKEGIGPVGAVSLYHIDWENKRGEFAKSDSRFRRLGRSYQLDGKTGGFNS